MSNSRRPAAVIENSILAALPRSDYRRILPSLKHVDLTLGEILYENNAAIKHVYFPDRSVVSLIWGNRDKLSIEVGLVGSEGMVGICLISGVKSVPYSTVVRRADSAMRMDAGAFKAEFARGGALQKLLLSYIHGLFVQVSRTAICNRIHPLQERFCRCLLMIQDRAKSCELILTHEFIANMLGARRSDVTIAAGILQRAGLIRYSRGHITILDRNGLEAASCNCYQISKEEFNRIGLGW